MNFIMPPLKSSNKHLTTVSNTKTNDNDYLLNLPKSNENKSPYTCRKYAPKVLQNLNSLRRNSRFCDVEIIAGDKVMKAHRAILAASSPYFHAMFTGGLAEQQQGSVELHSVAPHILDQLLDFIYSGSIPIDQSNVQELIVAADMLELNEVVEGCTEYMKRELHDTNAIGIYRFADGHNCEDLSTSAIDYIHSHFPKVCLEDEWLELPKEQLVKFLTSEQLRVDSEFQVFSAAVRWITYNTVERRRYVFEILRHVRLPLLSLCLLEKSVGECQDASLKVALRSIHNDLASKKGSLVPLYVQPRKYAKKNIFVIGGSKREPTSGWHRSESSFTSVERFDTFRREWCKASPMGISRILPGVATLNGCIYVIGGEQESKILANGECYDPLEDKWSQIASMVIPRCEFGLCALDGNLYAMGGWVGEDIGDLIEKYDPEKDKWRIEGYMPQARFSMGVVSYDGLIYMVGGCSQNERHLAELISYEPGSGEWRRLPPMLVARSQMGVAVLYDSLYAVGGTNRHNEVLSSVERYSFKQNKWYPVANMSVARGCPAVAAADGLLYVIGGDQTHDVNFYRAQYTLASVECYDPHTDVWQDCPQLPESRAEAGAVVV